MNSSLRPLTSEDSRLFFRFKGNGASNAPGVWLTRGIYIGFSGLDASLCVFPAANPGLMTSLDHRVAMSPQAGAPLTSLQQILQWLHWFRDKSLRVPIYRTCLSLKRSTEVKNWMALSSLSWKQSKALCFQHLKATIAIYDSLKFKGHRPLQPAFEKSKPCCILNMSPVIRSVTDIVFLYFTKQILHNSDTKDCREQMQICHCTVVLIKLLETLYG